MSRVGGRFGGYGPENELRRTIQAPVAYVHVTKRIIADNAAAGAANGLSRPFSPARAQNSMSPPRGKNQRHHSKSSSGCARPKWHTLTLLRSTCRWSRQAHRPRARRRRRPTAPRLPMVTTRPALLWKVSQHPGTRPSQSAAAHPRGNPRLGVATVFMRVTRRQGMQLRQLLSPKIPIHPRQATVHRKQTLHSTRLKLHRHLLLAARIDVAAGAGQHPATPRPGSLGRQDLAAVPRARTVEAWP